MWYGMAPTWWRLQLIDHHGMRYHYNLATTIRKLLYTMTTTCYKPPCNTKISTLLLEIFYVAFRAFAKELFLPTNVKPQYLLNNYLYYTPFGAFHCKCHTTKLSKRDIHPQAAYMVQAMCQSAEQVSCKCTHEVGRGLFMKQYHSNELVHVRG
jgi:hypothetical protein